MKKQRYIIIFASLVGIVLCIALAKIYPSRSPTYYHLVVDTTVVADRPAVYHFYLHPQKSIYADDADFSGLIDVDITTRGTEVFVYLNDVELIFDPVIWDYVYLSTFMGGSTDYSDPKTHQLKAWYPLQ